MDILANFFSTVQNGQLRKKVFVFTPFSRLVWNICSVLFLHGFIQGFQKISTTSGFQIQIFLKYANHKAVITKIKKVSLQSRRIYISKPTSLSLNGNDSAPCFGIKILSTSKGIISEHDAFFLGIGGELLCEIY
jgi:small subunit ribosomal protein S8